MADIGCRGPMDAAMRVRLVTRVDAPVTASAPCNRAGTRSDPRNPPFTG